MKTVAVTKESWVIVRAARGPKNSLRRTIRTNAIKIVVKIVSGGREAIPWVEPAPRSANHGPHPEYLRMIMWKATATNASRAPQYWSFHHIRVPIARSTDATERIRRKT